MTYISEIYKYRRPVLQWNSVTTVNVQDQIYTGIGGDCTVLFGDGKLLTVNNITQTRFDITRNAVLSGSKQSGLRTGSEATDTWYALYAVRATDNDNTWVTVGDTVFPVNSSISTLNSNFGLNKWLYLGLIRNGDGSAVTGDILKFTQSGNVTYLYNSEASINGGGMFGIRLAASAASSVTWNYASGSSGAVLPANLSLIYWTVGTSNGGVNAEWLVRDASPVWTYFRASVLGGNRTMASFLANASSGINLSVASFGSGQDINVAGWIDDALGVGSNPLV